MDPAAKQALRYTLQDYLEWPEDERWELIDGAACNMTPAPGIRHQKIVGKLYRELSDHPDNVCFTGIAPIDVVFDEYNVVQPDILVVCDKTKITEKNIQGAPDLIIEVASPSTEVKDRREKRSLYERFGVKEYVIVFPEREYVERYALNESAYGPAEIFNWDETLSLASFPITLDLAEVFERTREEKASPTSPPPR